MHGLGTIISQNGKVANEIRRFAEDHFPEYYRRVAAHAADTQFDGLTPAPVLWGAHLLAIVWHADNGYIEFIEVLQRKKLRKFFRFLPTQHRDRILRPSKETDSRIVDPQDASDGED